MIVFMDESMTGNRGPDASMRWVVVFVAAIALMLFDPVAGLISQMVPPAQQQGALVEPADVGSPMLEIQAKYVMGVERATGRSISEMRLGPKPGQYVEMAGGDQIDRVRAVVLISEIFGAEEGLERASALRAEIADLDEGLGEDLAIVESVLGGSGASVDERARLIDRHGFFGELVVAQIEDDAGAAEIRERLGEKAVVLAAVLFTFGALVLVSVLVGFVLLVVFVIFFANGRWKTRFGGQLRAEPSAEYNWVMVETVALFLVSFFAYKLIATLVSGFVPGVVLLGGQFALAGIVFWPAVRLGSLQRASALLGWTRGGGVLTEVAMGFVTYLAGLPVVALGLMMALLLVSVFGGMPSHPVTEGVSSGGLLEIVLLYVLACVWAPIVEETIFRGAFYRGLRVQVPGILGVLVASGVSSFIFAAIHPQGILFVPALMGLAIVFSFMREWRGSLIGPIFAHAMHNATLVTLTILVFGG